MSLGDGLTLYTMILVVSCIVILLSDLLWHSNHNWHLSKSKLMTCRKCGNVFLRKRQQIGHRCPECGGATTPFHLPYSGMHEALAQRARKLKR